MRNSSVTLSVFSASPLGIRVGKNAGVHSVFTHVHNRKLMTTTDNHHQSQTRTRRSNTAAHRSAPIRFRDQHGRECYKVPLDRQGQYHATVTARDYQTIREAGATGAWYLNGNGSGGAYVRIHFNRTRLMPARIIAGAGPRSVVRYINGDSLDLRPENIVLQRGASKKADAFIVADHISTGLDTGW
jgi:hypothetical protein